MLCKHVRWGACVPHLACLQNIRIYLYYSSPMSSSLFSILPGLAYAWLLFAYRRAWRSMPNAVLSENFEPQKRITILVPARNEAGKIEACLQSILDGNYPPNLLEIIVLDDFSEDETREVASKQFQSIRLLSLADYLPLDARFTSNKKKAISLGVSQANGELIVCTDADCIAPKNWLLHLASAFEDPEIRLVCGPVVFHQEQTLLQRFQALDFLGMMGITGAGIWKNWHFMANGANLAYRKSAFELVNGFEGNEHLASGDDMFLVQKVARRWPGSVAFLKTREAAVQTEAAPDLRSFMQQRLRWGTKNAAIPDLRLRLSLLVVFLFCWSIFLNLAFACIQPSSESLSLLGFQIALKALFDYFLLSEMCRFFNRRDLLRWFWPSFWMHTVYIVVLGTASLFAKKYTWKGRQSN